MSKYTSSLPFTERNSTGETYGYGTVPGGMPVNTTASTAESPTQNTQFQQLLPPPTDGQVSSKSSRWLYALLLSLALLSALFLIVSTATPEIYSRTADSNGIMDGTHFGYWRACSQMGGLYGGYVDCNDFHHEEGITAAKAFAVLSDIFAVGVCVMLLLMCGVRTMQSTKSLWNLAYLAVLVVLCTIIALAVFIGESKNKWSELQMEYGGVLAITGGSMQLIIAIITGRVASEKKLLALNQATLPL